MQTKQCSKCHQVKAVEEIRVNSRECKECHREWCRNYHRTPQGKARLAIYHKSKEFKDAQKRYYNSPKCVAKRLAMRKPPLTDEEKAVRAEAAKIKREAYQKSERRRSLDALWRKSEKAILYRANYYSRPEVKKRKDEYRKTPAMMAYRERYKKIPERILINRMRAKVRLKLVRSGVFVTAKTRQFFQTMNLVGELNKQATTENENIIIK